MSTAQTDSSNELQKVIYQNFCSFVDEFSEGMVDYDSVEDELDSMIDDEEVTKHTFVMCKKYWENAKDEDSFFQEEERRKWDVFYKDSGVTDVY